MAKSGVSVRWNGLDKMIAAAPQKVAESRKAILRDVGEAMVTSTVLRFSAGVGPDGTAWTESQRAKDEKGKTLVDAGQLRASINAAVTGSEVLWGSNLAYARIHQLGGEAGRNHAVTLPARPYLGMSDDDKAEAAAIIAAHLKNALGGG